jgi:hypothetical protein
VSDSRVRASAFRDIEDPLLASVDESLAEEEALEGFMGRERADPVDLDEDFDDCPFELGLAQPRALCLVRLYELTGQELPAAVAASIGPARRPVLFVHQVTPFSRFGYPPTRVWGLGYQIENLPDELVPVDFAPKSEHLEIGSVGTDVRLGFNAGGTFEAGAGLAEFRGLLPGTGIDDLGYSAKADGHFALTIDLRIQVLKVQAGLSGRGVRWDFIEQDERIDKSLELLQTALLPEGADEVEMDVKAWVRRRRKFLGFGAARSWIFEPRRMTVPIEK